MRVLVTGGAGFVGSHIVDHLVARGDEVVVIDDLSTGKRENVNQGATLVIDDIRQCPSILGGVEAIVHAAAYADLRHNWEKEGERDRLYSSNVDVTRYVLEHMGPSTKLAFLSTASVYGAARNASAVTETDAGPHTCESPYAASKMACEAMIAAYAFARMFRWKIGRLTNVVGKRTQHGVIGDFVRKQNGNGHIHAEDNGVQRKSWVHVSDVADAFLRMLDDDVPDGIYSVTSRERHSWWSVIDAMGIDKETVKVKDRPGGAIGDPVNLSVSGAKLAPYYRCERSITLGMTEALAHLGWAA